MEHIAVALLELARRYPCEYEAPYVVLIRLLESASRDSAAAVRTLESARPALTEQAASQVHWAALLFPRATVEHPESLDLLNRVSNRGLRSEDRRPDVLTMPPSTVGLSGPCGDLGGAAIGIVGPRRTARNEPPRSGAPYFI
ncbi:MAG: hypothetical protein ABI612_07030 [Betaproteobacteria bacterium]